MIFEAQLEDIIRLDEHPEMSNLVNQLCETPYTEADPVMKSRIRELRESFGIIDIPETPNVLEVFICLAKAADIVMFDYDAGNRTASWFWQIVDNVGLTEFDNNHYDKQAVSRVLESLLKRKYSHNGIGSVGFTHRDDIDFRKLDLWNQFSIWLSETYRKDF